MGSSTKAECVVMVTGGSGFLGQHVIKLLNTHADHVTSIRVVDLVQFENKLDYKPTKPIHPYVGSINDEMLMREAMKGCHCVIHIAGITDVAMFPNKEKLEKIHIEGTAVTLSVAQTTHGVQRFIGCGTFAVLNNATNIVNGTEETPIPTKWLYQEYASTKYASEQLVLDANSDTFPTVVIRPTTMYGELDDITVVSILRLAKQNRGIVYQVNCGENKHQMSYVGNVAWGFVCAEKRLYEEQKTLITSHKQEVQLLETRENVNDRMKHSNEQKTIAGRVYHIADDTPNQNLFKFAEHFVTPCGFRMSRLKTPYHLVLVFIYNVYFFLYFLSLFGIKLNMNYSIPAVRFLNSTLIVSYEKAKTELDYAPLFTPEESKEKSLRFYKEFVDKLGTT